VYNQYGYVSSAAQLVYAKADTDEYKIVDLRVTHVDRIKQKITLAWSLPNLTIKTNRPGFLMYINDLSERTPENADPLDDCVDPQKGCTYTCCEHTTLNEHSRYKLWVVAFRGSHTERSNDVLTGTWDGVARGSLPLTFTDLGGGRVRLQWILADGDALVPGEVRAYDINVDAVGVMPTTRNYTQTANELSLVIDGLQPAATYRFRVVPVTGAGRPGADELAKSAFAWTQYVVPSSRLDERTLLPAPTKFHVQPVANGFMLQWMFDSLQDVAKIILNVTRIDSDHSPTTIELQSTQTSYSVKQLSKYDSCRE
jgi:hypothetical protein